MFGLVPGIHDFAAGDIVKDVHGRDKPAMTRGKDKKRAATLRPRPFKRNATERYADY